jgi:hypothetical protein
MQTFEVEGKEGQRTHLERGPFIFEIEGRSLEERLGSILEESFRCWRTCRTNGGDCIHTVGIKQNLATVGHKRYRVEAQLRVEMTRTLKGAWR